MHVFNQWKKPATFRDHKGDLCTTECVSSTVMKHQITNGQEKRLRVGVERRRNGVKQLAAADQTWIMAIVRRTFSFYRRFIFFSVRHPLQCSKLFRCRVRVLRKESI